MFIRILVICLIVILSGCGDSSEDIALAKELGATRRAIFKECMELATQHSFEDSSTPDVIEQCSTVSYRIIKSYR